MAVKLVPMKKRPDPTLKKPPDPNSAVMRLIMETIRKGKMMKLPPSK
jgi:hypothetical protein